MNKEDVSAAATCTLHSGQAFGSNYMSVVCRTICHISSNGVSYISCAVSWMRPLVSHLFLEQKLFIITSLVYAKVKFAKTLQNLY